MQLPDTLPESLRPCNTDPDPAALAAGQLQNKVHTVLSRPRHPLPSPAYLTAPADHVLG